MKRVREGSVRDLFPIITLYTKSIFSSAAKEELRRKGRYLKPKLVERYQAHLQETHQKEDLKWKHVWRGGPRMWTYVFVHAATSGFTSSQRQEAAMESIGAPREAASIVNEIVFGGLVTAWYVGSSLLLDQVPSPDEASTTIDAYLSGNMPELDWLKNAVRQTVNRIEPVYDTISKVGLYTNIVNHGARTWYSVKERRASRNYGGITGMICLPVKGIEILYERNGWKFKEGGLMQRVFQNPTDLQEESQITAERMPGTSPYTTV